MKRILALPLLFLACSEPNAPEFRTIDFSNRSTEQVHITIPGAYDTYLPGLTGICGFLTAPYAPQLTVTVANAGTRQLDFNPSAAPHWQLRIFTDSIILVPLIASPC